MIQCIIVLWLNDVSVQCIVTLPNYYDSILLTDIHSVYILQYSLHYSIILILLEAIPFYWWLHCSALWCSCDVVFILLFWCQTYDDIYWWSAREWLILLLLLILLMLFIVAFCSYCDFDTIHSVMLVFVLLIHDIRCYARCWWCIVVISIVVLMMYYVRCWFGWFCWVLLLLRYLTNGDWPHCVTVTWCILTYDVLHDLLLLLVFPRLLLLLVICFVGGGDWYI